MRLLWLVSKIFIIFWQYISVTIDMVVGVTCSSLAKGWRVNSARVLWGMVWLKHQFMDWLACWERRQVVYQLYFCEFMSVSLPNYQLDYFVYYSCLMKYQYKPVLNKSYDFWRQSYKKFYGHDLRIFVISQYLSLANISSLV